MKKDNEDKLLELFEEISNITYSMNIGIIETKDSLYDMELSAKQIRLMDLVKRESKVTIGQLAQSMEVTSSAVSQIVSKLEGESYLVRSINPDNRREILVELGEKAYDYYLQEDEVNREIVSRFYSKMEMEELVQLRDLLVKLNRIVEDELKG